MAKRKRAFDPRKDQHWRDVLARFHVSGLSVRAFCRQEQLREPSFYAWRRTIARRDGKPQPIGNRATPRVSEPAFVPLMLRREVASPAPQGIAIELRGGRVLRLPDSMPAERVAELIRVLESGEAVS